MKLVVDANILFAALIKNSSTQEIIFHKELELFIPEFIFSEFAKYELFLRDKTKMSEKDFDELLIRFKNKINVVSEKEINEKLEEAKNISPDTKDAPYIAAALKLEIPLWSNDYALKKQEKVIVFSTFELLTILNIS